MKIALFILSFLLLSLSLAASDQVPGAPQDRPIALVGGTIHTVSGDVIENGTILFEDGKITAIGKTIDLPAGTEKINVSGKHVYPSLIDANTALGLVEVSAVRATRDYAEVGSITPEVKSVTAFNPDSELLPVTRANGILIALSAPTSGLISGTSSVMMLDGWTWEQMSLKTPAGLHIRWPRIREPEKKGETPRYLKDIQSIRDAFAKARAYITAKNAGKNHESNRRLAALIPAIQKEIPVFVHANRIRQIQTALAWALEEDVKMILVGGYDAWRVADLLKAHQIPVIITQTHRLPYRRWEGYDTPFTLPLKLHKAGVNYCIAGNGGAFAAAHTRSLPYNAGTAAAYGLPKAEALKSLTLYPAQILGVADKVGSLETGKDATLFVCDGDPLEIMSHVEIAFIQGRKVDLSSRHTQLYEKYQEKYRQLGVGK